MASSANATSSQPQMATGTFTSAESAVAEVITIGFNPTYIYVLIDQGATSPDEVRAWSGATDSSFNTGSTGVITSPTNEVTFTGDGTVTLSATPQNNDGVNFWYAIR